MSENIILDSIYDGFDESDIPPGLPGGLAELKDCFERYGITPEGQRMVLRTLKDPARRVGGGRRNTVVRYASQKMERVIQAESRTVELPFVQMCENDPNVVFYLCQPALHVEGLDSKGRLSRRLRTMDFLLLKTGDDEDEAGFWLVECKVGEKLREEASKPNARYTLDGSRWRWLAAEEAAAQLGLRFRVFSSDEIDTYWCMNIGFLSDFVDIPCPDVEAAEILKDWLAEAGSLRIRQALSLYKEKPEVVWWLIANYEVWADLSEELVFEDDVSSIYASEMQMLLGRRLRRPVDGVALSRKISGVCVEPGSPVSLDGQPFVILNRGEKEVFLRQDVKDGKVISLPHSEFFRLVGEGMVRGEEDGDAERISEQRWALCRKVGVEGLKEAFQREVVLREYRETGVVPAGSSRRSVERYEMWAREGERLYGDEFFGLIRCRGRKPGKRDLDSARLEMLEKGAEWYGGEWGGAGYSVVYRQVLKECKKVGIDPPPSYPTLIRHIKKEPDDEVTNRREGWDRAYPKSGPVGRPKDVPAIPPRVFDMAHVDHTPLSVKLVSRFGDVVLKHRAYLTFMVDGHSGMPLAMSLSLNEPSRVALSEVLLDCADRHSRFPDSIVVDQGAEFGSVNWEKTLVDLRINKVERPASEPKVGSVIESHFGVTDAKFIHALPGSMKLSKAGRKLSLTHDPARFAVLTFPQLQEGCEKWFFDVFPHLPHREYAATRKEVFDESLRYSGARVSRYQPLDESLRMLLALPVEGEMRQVRSGKGITVMGLRYWHESFRRGDVVGKNVRVKVDALDASMVFAYVPGAGEWVICRLSNQRVRLHGRSWKLVRLAIQESRRLNQIGAQSRWINEVRVSELIEEMVEDSKLSRQSEREREMRQDSQSRTERDGDRQFQSGDCVSDGLVAWSEDDETELDLNADGLDGVEPCDVAN